MTDFAATEARVNASAVGRVSNAQALFAGVATPVAVIFDAAAERNQIGTVGMVTSMPAISLLTSDVPDPPEGKLVTVRGMNFTVAEHDPDGTGMSTLYLTKA